MTWTQKFFSFEGRMGRQDFWICTLIIWGVKLTVGFGLAMAVFAVVGLPGITGKNTLSEIEAARFGLGMVGLFGMVLLIQLAMIWPDMAVKMKRFHDRDQPGALAAIFFLNWVPLLNYLTIVPLFVFWLIDLGILEGTPGPNRYGQSTDPRHLSNTVFA